MAFLGQTIEVNTLPESTSYELLPVGWYAVTIVDAELKDTKDGTGQYISLRYSVSGPTHQGRTVYGNINIKNKSIKAEEIGRADLGSLMRAIGLPRVSDTDELLNGQLQIKVGISEARTDPSTGKTYEARNEVKGYKALAGGMPPVAAPTFPPVAAAPTFPPLPQTQAAAPAAPQASASPPWAKR